MFDNLHLTSIEFRQTVSTCWRCVVKLSHGDTVLFKPPKNHNKTGIKQNSYANVCRNIFCIQYHVILVTDDHFWEDVKGFASQCFQLTYHLDSFRWSKRKWMHGFTGTHPVRVRHLPEVPCAPEPVELKLTSAKYFYCFGSRFQIFVLMEYIWLHSTSCPTFGIMLLCRVSSEKVKTTQLHHVPTFKVFAISQEATKTESTTMHLWQRFAVSGRQDKVGYSLQSVVVGWHRGWRSRQGKKPPQNRVQLSC